MHTPGFSSRDGRNFLTTSLAQPIILDPKRWAPTRLSDSPERLLEVVCESEVTGWGSVFCRRRGHCENWRKGRGQTCEGWHFPFPPQSLTNWAFAPAPENSLRFSFSSEKGYKIPFRTMRGSHLYNVLFSIQGLSEIHPSASFKKSMNISQYSWDYYHHGVLRTLLIVYAPYGSRVERFLLFANRGLFVHSPTNVC